MTTPNLPDPQDAAMVNAIIGGMDFDKYIDRLKGLFEGHQLRVMTATVDTLNTATGLGVGIPDHTAREIVARGGTNLLGMDIEGQTRKALFQALRDARAAGLHPSLTGGVLQRSMASMIQEHVSAGRFVHAGPEYRAKLISRTETAFAQNESSLMGYEQSRAVRAVEAVDNQIGHDDQDCIERNGQIMSAAEARHITDHPNGTLRWLPVVD